MQGPPGSFSAAPWDRAFAARSHAADTGVSRSSCGISRRACDPVPWTQRRPARPRSSVAPLSFPKPASRCQRPMGRAASARPASAADLRRCAVTAAAQDQGHGHMIDRGVCPEGREGASARSDGQAPHRPERAEPKGHRHCAAGSPAGTGPFPGQDQDRLIVWMKHENSSPCEPIRSLA